MLKVSCKVYKETTTLSCPAQAQTVKGRQRHLSEPLKVSWVICFFLLEVSLNSPPSLVHDLIFSVK